MKLSFLTVALTLAGLSATATAQTDDCANNNYCVKFDKLVSALDGSSTTSDISITYDASPDTPAELSYEVSILRSSDGVKCDTELTDAATAGVAVAATNGIAHGSHGEAFDQLKVNLDIDTAKIEAGELTPSNANTLTSYNLTFCTSVNLMYESADIAKSAMATAKNIFTLLIDKSQGFDFAVTAAQDATGTASDDVVVSYPLNECICAIGSDDPVYDANGVVTCIPNPPALFPGSTFKFCIQAVDEKPSPTALNSEVSVAGLKDVAFTNTGDATLSIPIVNDSGDKVGPSDISCTDKGCVVTAVTFAKMYEKLEGGVFQDISSTNKVEGRAVLSFTGAAGGGNGSGGPAPVAKIMAPDGNCRYDAANERVVGLCTGNVVKDLCNQHSLDCCKGPNACSWQATRVSISRGACQDNSNTFQAACRFYQGLASLTIGEGSCKTLAGGNCYDESPNPQTVLTIGKNSCNGDQYNCRFQQQGGNFIEEITIGDNSCNAGGNGVACNFESIYFPGTIFKIGHNSCLDGNQACGVRVNNFIVGNGSCHGSTACFARSIYADFGTFTAGDDSCKGNRSCASRTSTVGNNSCNGDHACQYHDDKYAWSRPIGTGSCNGNFACRTLNQVGVGDGSCLGEQICNGKATEIGDNEFVTRRRLGGNNSNGSAGSFITNDHHAVEDGETASSVGRSQNFVEVSFGGGGGGGDHGAAGSKAAISISNALLSRKLQTIDGAGTTTTTPVDEFAVEVNLATPPDRSGATTVMNVAGTSSSMMLVTVVSIMMGGCLVGLLV